MRPSLGLACGHKSPGASVFFEETGRLEKRFTALWLFAFDEYCEQSVGCFNLFPGWFCEISILGGGELLLASQHGKSFLWINSWIP